mmetsp:Transcript_36254/g.104399  ORF Transcript_36254/g.104399 Transcript_36254/m.104399 type:complete len:376 (-) Transcript_36254:262-1389(-)
MALHEESCAPLHGDFLESGSEDSTHRGDLHPIREGDRSSCQSRTFTRASGVLAISALICASAFAWHHRMLDGMPGLGMHVSNTNRPHESLLSESISLAAKGNRSNTQERQNVSGSGIAEQEKPWEEVHVNSSGPLSFFCFTVIITGGNEETLLTFQWEKKINIFQCDAWEVIADKSKQMGGSGSKGFRTTLLTDGLHDKKGKVGVDCSETPGYLNSWTFMNVWELVIKQRRVWHHDFIIKMDVDAVFFPSRLPAHVQPYRGKPVIFTTCPGNKLWGSLELVSRAALATYASHMDWKPRGPHEPACPKACKALPWWCWGEDQYLQKCMESLGVPSAFDQGLVQQGCNPGTCRDPKVAFHKYGEIWRQKQCLQLANR